MTILYDMHIINIFIFFKEQIIMCIFSYKMKANKRENDGVHCL